MTMKKSTLSGARLEATDPEYLVGELVEAMQQLDDPFKRLVLTRIAESLLGADRRHAELALELFEQVRSVQNTEWVQSVN